MEKPLAVDEEDLVEIDLLRQCWKLDVVVVTPWLASALTHRIQKILRGGELGAPRSVSVIQSRPRFTRSLGRGGHLTAFDVGLPHSVGLALALAGDAKVRDAGLSDMRLEDLVIPRLGSAWLSLEHETGARTELLSDLTAPTRERRITLELERGTLIGHYSSSEADDTAQLRTTVDGRETRAVFRDDALTTFMQCAYAHFAAPGRGHDDLALNFKVVWPLSEAKRMCARLEPSRRRAPAARGDAVAPTPAIVYTGIGDEAGESLASPVDALAQSAIVLRTVDGVAIADLDGPAFAWLADTLAARGLAVVCAASRIGNWERPIIGDFGQDLDELGILASRCAALGARYVRVMSYLNAGLCEREWGRRATDPDRLRELAGRAEQAGLVLLHENPTGWAAAAERMLHLMDAVGSPALRLLFDTGNGMAYGYEAPDLLPHILDHVAHVHVKDADGSAADPVYTLPDAGRARVADCLRLLLGSGYTGAWSIEPHLSLRPHEPTLTLVQGDDAGGFAANNAHARGEFADLAQLRTSPPVSRGSSPASKRRPPREGGWR